jgi:hypothetical protein
MNKTLNYYILFFSFVAAFVTVSFVISGIQPEYSAIGNEELMNEKGNSASENEHCPWVKKHYKKHNRTDEQKKAKYLPVNLNTKAPVKII